MAPRRRPSSRSTRDGTGVFPEQPEASGDPVLREQMSTLMGVVLRQEEQIKELHELLARQIAAAAPVAACRVSTGVAMDSGVVASDSVEVEAEKERALAALMTFKKFDPPVFDGENVDPWIVEMWIDSMETLFEELYALERDKVPLAVHCLKLSAKVWWKSIRRNRSPSLPPMAWDEFRGLVFSTYFPDTEKRKLQDRFRKLRQGGRSVGEYEREFSRIVNCVPDVVRDDKDMADWFLHGLRPEIYERVQILRLTTFTEVLDRALLAEHGDAFVREKHESSERQRGGVKPLSRDSGGQSSSKRHSKSFSSRSSPGCVICGGSY
ncbi:uncharacterized protein LOC109705031 [Ananas comosus]|uniref:Uncharacterized protein LOC109705030 n=1 Tax=Ananas comosus TaxID=4615 RepID=A0A6P5ED86_ANACO|nr:uncharacterized protein LOC109705030 [Ananas comosus]XP_020081384.1 uncharacterized protein LOC109705031 [Ananas comosus]